MQKQIPFQTEQWVYTQSYLYKLLQETGWVTKYVENSYALMIYMGNKPQGV